MEKRTGLPQGKAEKGYCMLENRTVRGICTQAMRSGEGERKRRERRVKRGATDQEVKRGTSSQESMQTKWLGYIGERRSWGKRKETWGLER